MKLDPQAKALLERAIAAGAPKFQDVGAVRARELYATMRAATRGTVPEVASAEDLQCPGPAGPIPLRVYRAIETRADEVLPVMVFFHGGGWVVGDIPTSDVTCRALANACRAAVVSVDYRLAPEHKFPAAAEDSIAATQWVAANAARLRVDASRLVVAGDSAGGNLAAVVALAARDAGRPAIAAQILIYPVCDVAMDTPSYAEMGSGYSLTGATMKWFAEQYLRGPADTTDWRVAPRRHISHAGLPPAYIITAGFDPLRDEAEAYGQQLKAAGVSVTYECFEGMMHGFAGQPGALAAANHAVYRIAQQLRPIFGKA